MCVLSRVIFKGIACVQVPTEPEEGTSRLGTEAADGCVRAYQSRPGSLFIWRFLGGFVSSTLVGLLDVFAEILLLTLGGLKF